MSELEKSERPWGRYEVLQESSTHKVKCIWMKPGTRLSYQRHKHRAEHWFIVQGTGEVTIDGQISQVKPGDTVEFKVGVLHRLANTGKDEIVFVEVQTHGIFETLGWRRVRPHCPHCLTWLKKLTAINH